MSSTEVDFDPTKLTETYLRDNNLVVVGVGERYWQPERPTVRPEMPGRFADPKGNFLWAESGAVIGHTYPEGALRMIAKACASAAGLLPVNVNTLDPHKGEIPDAPMKFYLTQRAKAFFDALPADQVVGRLVEIPNNPDVWTEFPKGFGPRGSMLWTRQEVSGPNHLVRGAHLGALAVDGFLDGSKAVSAAILDRIPSAKLLSHTEGMPT